MPAAWVSRILTDLEPRVVVTWDGRRGFRHGVAPSAAERREIGEAVAALDADIASPLRTDTAVQSARKLGTMGAGKDTFSAGAFVDALIDALPGTSDAALGEATRRILAGEVPGVSKDFMPTTARLVSLAREIADGWRIRRARLAEMLEFPERPAELEEVAFTPEQMAGMRARMERLAAGEAARMSVTTPKAPGPSAAIRVAEDLRRRKARAHAGTCLD